MYHRRQIVAAQVAKELKTVTYATPPMEECRKRTRKKKGHLLNFGVRYGSEVIYSPWVMKRQPVSTTLIMIIRDYS